MAELVEKRWTRYGKDRVYVQTTDGIDVGHVDLQARTVVVKHPDFEVALHECLARWCPGDVVRDPSETVADDPSSVKEEALAEESEKRHEESDESPAAPELDEPRDLVENVAGDAARVKRDEVNAEAPVLNLVARVLGVKTDERSWRVGAKGEEKVAARLAKLGEGWHQIHAVPVGENDSDIDHVVIGPPGVFTLNTKRHPRGKAWVGEGVVMVNGQKTAYLRNSRFEARRTAELLSNACGFPVSVTPVIVFVDLDSYTVKQLPPDVRVTTRWRLVTWFRTLPPSLDANTVEVIFAKARLSTTWRPPKE